VGQLLPIAPEAMRALGGAVGVADAGKVWSLILLGYCYLASVTPVWILLQPRDYLSSFLLFAAVLASAAGLLFGGFGIEYPAFTGFQAPIGPLFPVLFVTIACGAVSGFHSVISSGTTAKQLARERSAKTIGYGAMVAEGIVALIAVATVAMVAREGSIAAAYRGLTVTPVEVFSAGMGCFTEVFGIPASLGAKFGGLAISTFLLTTLDTCTRLGRFLFHEFFGIRNLKARYLSSLLVVALPALFVFLPFYDATGRPVPAWKGIWPVFGSANQLLAGLGLLVVFVWMRKQGQRALWAAVPMVFMIAITLTSLGMSILSGTQTRLVVAIAALLFLLGVVTIVLGIRALPRGFVPAPFAAAEPPAREAAARGREGR